MISSDDDPNSTKSDGEYDSEHDPDVDMRMQNNVDAPDVFELDGNVDMEREGDEEQKEYEEDKDDDEMDEDDERYKDEDNGKEPRMIGQGEMVNISSHD